MDKRANLTKEKPTGLSTAEALQRLESEGYNELPAAGRRSFWAPAMEILREPMFAMLIGATLLYAALGDLGEAAILLAFASISVTIVVVQRGRSERALEALRDLTSPRALVFRDGKPVRIPGREVVRGDLMVIGEGDRVPADGVLVSGDHLEMDESLLTGESITVLKNAATPMPAKPGLPGGSDSPQVFSGSLVVHGTGLATILATGPRSAIGAIGLSLAGIKTEQPRLQRETRRLVVIFAVVGAIFSASAFLLTGVLAWQLDRGTARQPCAEHVAAAGRVSAGPDGVHGDGRLATVEAAGAHTPCSRDRDTGRCNHALHGQDRHLDAQFDVGGTFEHRHRPVAARQPRGSDLSIRTLVGPA